jgi:hypothetical protein
MVRLVNGPELSIKRINQNLELKFSIIRIYYSKPLMNRQVIISVLCESFFEYNIGMVAERTRVVQIKSVCKFRNKILNIMNLIFKNTIGRVGDRTRFVQIKIDAN